MNNARLVSDNKFLHNIIISSETETDIGQSGYLLVGMEVDTVDWTIGLVNFLTGQIPHLQVPDPR